MSAELRRLAAIVSADVAGYSRLMGRDESDMLAALTGLRHEVVIRRLLSTAAAPTALAAMSWRSIGALPAS